MPGVHDLAGQQLADGRPLSPIDTRAHPHSDFDRRVDALVSLLMARRVFIVDELRRAIESLDAERYHRLSYYERWAEALKILLLEKDVLGAEELEQRLKTIEGQLIRSGHRR